MADGPSAARHATQRELAEADSHVPLHEVDPPVGGERRLMTLRHNLGGPGAGYTV
ncbi:MAG: hypothetical protein M0Z95_25670 [Actinomycetota bacterium]|nr:hypothetical protein [Actinomycetota bacterium]